MTFHEKIFDFGKIDLNNIGRKINKVTVNVHLYGESKDDMMFAAMVNVWNGSSTDIVTGGQCFDRVAEYLHGNVLFNRIYSLWKKYHLKKCSEIPDIGLNDIKMLLQA